MGEEKQENEAFSGATSIELRAFQLPVRTRQNSYVISCTNLSQFEILAILLYNYLFNFFKCIPISGKEKARQYL